MYRNSCHVIMNKKCNFRTICLLNFVHYSNEKNFTRLRNIFKYLSRTDLGRENFQKLPASHNFSNTPKKNERQGMKKSAGKKNTEPNVEEKARVWQKPQAQPRKLLKKKKEGAGRQKKIRAHRCCCKDIA